MNVIKVKSGDSFAIINATDYDEKTHELYEGETLDGKSDVQKLADEMETRRQLEANRGVVQSTASPDTDRNTSGTYSTPTPTDVRYPDKNETEFENNHGAFIGKSAPDLRAENKLADEPGGIYPNAEKKRRQLGKGADNLPASSQGAARSTEHNPDINGASGSDEGDSSTDDGGGEEVEIPADWEGTAWQTRVALAKRLSGRDDVKTDEANDIIEAEVARRV